MNKIYINYSPFSTMSSFHFNDISFLVPSEFNALSDAIITHCTELNTFDVYINGADGMIDGIRERVMSKEVQQYGLNKINIYKYGEN